MNTILTSGVVDPNRLQPFLAPSLAFLQAATKDMVKALCYSLMGTYNGSSPYAMYGATTSGTTVFTGYIFFGGELYFFAGQSKVGWAHNGVFVLSDTATSPDPIAYSDGTAGSVHRTRNLVLQDLADGTGLCNLSDLIFVQDRIDSLITMQTNLQGLKVKFINIGDWDMVSTAGITVAHGLSISNIRRVSALIKDDSNSSLAPIDFGSVTSGSISLSATNVVLTRYSGQTFDSTSYDSTGYNRGYIQIDYI